MIWRVQLAVTKGSATLIHELRLTNNHEIFLRIKYEWRAAVFKRRVAEEEQIERHRWKFYKVAFSDHGTEGTGCNRGQATIFATSSKEFIANPQLAHEIFGAASIIVRCADIGALTGVLAAMEGQLTASLQLDEGDTEAARGLLPLLDEPDRNDVGEALRSKLPSPVSSI